MTLDEAIEICEDKINCSLNRADEAYKRFCIFNNLEDCKEYDKCSACAEENLQLVEFLKDYRELLKEKE